MKKFLLIVLCAAMCACARPTPAPLPTADTDALWQKMASFHGPETYRDQFSMRFGQEGDTRRVTGILWGNAQTARLDIMAGVGAPIAKIRAAGSDFLLYLPQKQIAYSHQGAASPWFKLGVPIPLNLKQLAQLMNGDFGAVFQPEGGAKADGDGYSYPVGGATAGVLTINGQGQPIRWKSSKDGWLLNAAYDGENREPKSLRLTNVNGKMAVILIKEREANPSFTPEQLDLPLPAGTREELLADLKQGGIQF